MRKGEKLEKECTKKSLRVVDSTVPKKKGACRIGKMRKSLGTTPGLRRRNDSRNGVQEKVGHKSSGSRRAKPTTKGRSKITCAQLVKSGRRELRQAKKVIKKNRNQARQEAIRGVAVHK